MTRFAQYGADVSGVSHLCKGRELSARPGARPLRNDVQGYRLVLLVRTQGFRPTIQISHSFALGELKGGLEGCRGVRGPTSGEHGLLVQPKSNAAAPGHGLVLESPPAGQGAGRRLAERFQQHVRRA
eukprot:scaffold1289_cov274-Pinguiococcus_pyrenoidosus.AAC.4